MKIACLTDRLDRMPMVKLLAPFAAGIALADCYELPLWFLAGAFVCAGVVALLMRSGAAAGMLLLTAGFAAAQLRTPEADLPQQVPTLFEVVVTGFPSSGSATRRPMPRRRPGAIRQPDAGTPRRAGSAFTRTP